MNKTLLLGIAFVAAGGPSVSAGMIVSGERAVGGGFSAAAVPPAAMSLNQAGLEGSPGIFPAGGLAAHALAAASDAALPEAAPAPLAARAGDAVEDPTVADYQKELRALWAAERERTIAHTDTFDLHRETFWREQKLARQIAVARAGVPGATGEQKAQAEIAKVGLKISAHMSSLNVETMAEWGSQMRALMDELGEKKISLGGGEEPNFRAMALK